MTVRRSALGTALLGALLLVAALVVAVGRARDEVVVGAPSPPAAVGVLPAAGTPAATARPVRAPARDERLRIPRFGVDAPVVPVRLRGRVMQVPLDPARVGWWQQGAVPGATRGSAVFVGHVNYHGRSGALAVLPRLRPGDRVVLTRPGLRFRVAAVRSYAKTAGIPPATFSASGPAQLVLITCGGAFDAETGNYDDNVVVYARRT